jgi:hypothetical protein
MRQVKYTRPPDWVDPFQDTTSASSSAYGVPGSPAGSSAEEKSMRSDSSRGHSRNRCSTRHGRHGHRQGDDLGSINEDSSGDQQEPPRQIDGDRERISTTHSLNSSPLTTYRSTGSTTSQASAVAASRRSPSRNQSRVQKKTNKIRELRTSHLEQLNRYHGSSSGGGEGTHPRSAKRSASLQSLISNG